MTLANTIILVSSSNTFPSAPGLSYDIESQPIILPQIRNVIPVTPSKRPRLQITDTSSTTSTSYTSRPPITGYPEIPITSRCHSQPSLTHTPLVHIPNPESVERYVNYKQPIAIKTVRIQPQLNHVHILDTDYPPVPSLQLQSVSNRSATSKIYPPLKPLRKPSTSLSNHLDDSSEYIPSQESTSSLFVPHHRYNLRNLPTRRLGTTDTSTLNFSALSSNSALRLARQHAQPLSSDTHSKELVYNNHILHLVLILLHYFLLTFKLHSFLEIYSLKFLYLLLFLHLLDFLNITLQN